MKQKTILVTILLFFVFLFNSCKKKNAVQEEIAQPDTEKFFQIATNVSPELKAVVNDIKSQNGIYKFVPAFSKRYGFPVWGKVVSDLNISDTSAKASDAIFFIPLKIPDGDISSYIVCLKSDSGYRYKLYTRATLEYGLSTVNDEDSIKGLLSETMIIGFFEKSINNKDSVLFAENYFKKITINIHSLEKPNSGARVESDGYWDTQVVTTCFYVNGGNKRLAFGNDAKLDALGVSGTQACYNRLTTVWVGPTGSGGGGGGNSGGGGGSGSGGITGNYQCPSQEWWCESGEYRIVRGRLYTPDYYPGKNRTLPWLWWETSANYQNWLNRNISIIDDLSVSLALARPGASWLVANASQAEELHNLLTEYDYSAVSNSTARVLINLLIRNLQSSSYNSLIGDVLSQYLPANLNPSPTNDPIFWFYIGIQSAFNKIDHPEWSSLKCYWEAMQEFIHEGLDMAGLVPGFGEVADLTNGVIYTIQGNGVDATLSFAAAIPIAGWAATAAKYAKKTIYALDGTKRTLKWFKRATDGIIEFGDRDLLRKVLGLTTGDAWKAHHIIPWDLGKEKLIQKIAKSKNAFHLNERYNGIALTAIQHSGSHQAYSDRVKAALKAIEEKNLSDDDAFREAKDLIDRITTAITNNPNTPIDNIIF